MAAPLPTLRRTTPEQRLEELLDGALEDLACGEPADAFSGLLTAIEVAYGLGKLPPQLVRRIDALNAMRRLVR